MNHHLKGRNQYISTIYFTDTTLTSSKGNQVQSRCTKKPWMLKLIPGLDLNGSWIWDSLLTQFQTKLGFIYSKINIHSATMFNIQQFNCEWKARSTSMTYAVLDVLGYLYMAFWRSEDNNTSSTELYLIPVPEYRHLSCFHVKGCCLNPKQKTLHSQEMPIVFMLLIASCYREP